MQLGLFLLSLTLIKDLIRTLESTREGWSFENSLAICQTYHWFWILTSVS